VVDKVALRQVFSEYFGFPCQSSFHQFLHNHHHLSPGAGTLGQWWPQYQKSHPTNKKGTFLPYLLLSLLHIFFIGGVGHFWYCGHYWPIVPAPGDRWWWLWRNWWNKDWQGKPKYSEKTCSSATLSTTNPTWLDPGLNPGRRGEKPATNRLRYGAAKISLLQAMEPHRVARGRGSHVS
jgi:hypothetical protein